VPRDKKILYILAVLATAGLIPAVLLPPTLCPQLSAAWLAVCAIAALMLIKKRRAPSIHRKTVLLIMAVVALVYLTLTLLSGLIFGFVQTPGFSTARLWQGILPAVLIIVATELVRRILLSQEKRLPAVFAFVLGVLGELAAGGGLNGLSTFNAVMDVVGLTLLPAICAGFLYQFVSARYGAFPCIVYRLLFVLPPFFLSIASDIPDAIRSFIALLLPLVVLLFLRTLFEKQVKKATASPHSKRIELIAAIAALVIAAGIIALVSGQFRYSSIVIATGSMTGELNVGDMVVYERYEGQAVETGDIIVFERDHSQVIHRVVEIKHINAQTRYYTKGDANPTLDIGYITDADIVGITNFKIAFLGYPSLWMRRIFDFGL